MNYSALFAAQLLFCLSFSFYLFDLVVAQQVGVTRIGLKGK